LAEERARTEGIHTAFVFAIVGDCIEVSVRSVGLSVDVNSLCQKIFGKQNAGGKMGAGAAKLPLGFFAIDPNMEESLKDKMWDAIRDFIIDKILHIATGNA
jgi:nanoRNase/pAp phosphatase (c-di-AMP/oligoRNAs hydrolase)